MTYVFRLQALLPRLSDCTQNGGVIPKNLLHYGISVGHTQHVREECDSGGGRAVARALEGKQRSPQSPGRPVRASVRACACCLLSGWCRAGTTKRPPACGGHRWNWLPRPVAAMLSAAGAQFVGLAGVIRRDSETPTGRRTDRRPPARSFKVRAIASSRIARQAAPLSAGYSISNQDLTPPRLERKIAPRTMSQHSYVGRMNR